MPTRGAAHFLDIFDAMASQHILLEVPLTAPIITSVVPFCQATQRSGSQLDCIHYFHLQIGLIGKARFF